MKFYRTRILQIVEEFCNKCQHFPINNAHFATLHCAPPPLFLEIIIYAISVFYVTQACEGLKAKPVLKLR